jgi:hypothetical protein
MRQTCRFHLPGIIVWLTAILSGCDTTSVPSTFGISVNHEDLGSQTDMVISGTAFTPHGRVDISIRNFPKRTSDITRTAYAKSDGTFTLRESFALRTWESNEDPGDIFVNVRDNASGHFDSKSVSPWPYIAR